MSRKSIQVPSETKEKIEKKKEQLRARTEYDAIERLIKYHDQEANHVLLDDEVRDRLLNLKDKLRLYNASDVIKLLLHHYESSDAISKESLDLYLSMR